MRLLLDTHAFLWLMGEPEKVPGGVLAACGNTDNNLYLSIASVWEIQIKSGAGKLRLGYPLKDMLDEQQTTNALEILPVKLPHLWKLPELPARHNDPFDRLLIAQANAEDMHLVSGDRMFSDYPVKLLW